jgi:hypothetical protein
MLRPMNRQQLQMMLIGYGRPPEKSGRVYRKIVLAMCKRLDGTITTSAAIKLPKKNDTIWVRPKLKAKFAYRNLQSMGCCDTRASNWFRELIALS